MMLVILIFQCPLDGAAAGLFAMSFRSSIPSQNSPQDAKGLIERISNWREHLLPEEFPNPKAAWERLNAQQRSQNLPDLFTPHPTKLPEDKRTGARTWEREEKYATWFLGLEGPSELEQGLTDSEKELADRWRSPFTHCGKDDARADGGELEEVVLIGEGAAPDLDAETEEERERREERRWVRVPVNGFANAEVEEPVLVAPPEKGWWVLTHDVVGRPSTTYQDEDSEQDSDVLSEDEDPQIKIDGPFTLKQIRRKKETSWKELSAIIAKFREQHCFEHGGSFLGAAECLQTLEESHKLPKFFHDSFSHQPPTSTDDYLYGRLGDPPTEDEFHTLNELWPDTVLRLLENSVAEHDKAWLWFRSAPVGYEAVEESEDKSVSSGPDSWEQRRHSTFKRPYYDFLKDPLSFPNINFLASATEAGKGIGFWSESWRSGPHTVWPIAQHNRQSDWSWRVQNFDLDTLDEVVFKLVNEKEALIRDGGRAVHSQQHAFGDVVQEFPELVKEKSSRRGRKGAPRGRGGGGGAKGKPDLKAEFTKRFRNGDRGGTRKNLNPPRPVVHGEEPEHDERREDFMDGEWDEEEQQEPTNQHAAPSNPSFIKPPTAAIEGRERLMRRHRLRRFGNLRVTVKVEKNSTTSLLSSCADEQHVREIWWFQLHPEHIATLHKQISALQAYREERHRLLKSLEKTWEQRREQRLARTVGLKLLEKFGQLKLWTKYGGPEWIRRMVDAGEMDEYEEERVRAEMVDYRPDAVPERLRPANLPTSSEQDPHGGGGGAAAGREYLIWRVWRDSPWRAFLSENGSNFLSERPSNEAKKIFFQDEGFDSYPHRPRFEKLPPTFLPDPDVRSFDEKGIADNKKLRPTELVVEAWKNWEQSDAHPDKHAGLMMRSRLGVNVLYSEEEEDASSAEKRLMDSEKFFTPTDVWSDPRFWRLRFSDEAFEKYEQLVAKDVETKLNAAVVGASVVVVPAVAGPPVGSSTGVGDVVATVAGDRPDTTINILPDAPTISQMKDRPSNNPREPKRAGLFEGLFKGTYWEVQSGVSELQLALATTRIRAFFRGRGIPEALVKKIPLSGEAVAKQQILKPLEEEIYRAEETRKNLLSDETVGKQAVPHFPHLVRRGSTPHFAEMASADRLAQVHTALKRPFADDEDPELRGLTAKDAVVAVTGALADLRKKRDGRKSTEWARNKKVDGNEFKQEFIEIAELMNLPLADFRKQAAAEAAGEAEQQQQEQESTNTGSQSAVETGMGAGGFLSRDAASARSPSGSFYCGENRGGRSSPSWVGSALSRLLPTYQQSPAVGAAWLQSGWLRQHAGGSVVYGSAAPAATEAPTAAQEVEGPWTRRKNNSLRARLSGHGKHHPGHFEKDAWNYRVIVPTIPHVNDVQEWRAALKKWQVMLHDFGYVQTMAYVTRVVVSLSTSSILSCLSTCKLSEQIFLLMLKYLCCFLLGNICMIVVREILRAPVICQYFYEPPLPISSRGRIARLLHVVDT